MEKVRPWCGQPSDRGRLKNRTEQRFFDRSRQYCLMMNDTLSSRDILLSDSLLAKTDFCCMLYAKFAVSTFVNSQQPESYAKFLETISQCAELDDGDYPGVSRWLQTCW